MAVLNPGRIILSLANPFKNIVIKCNEIALRSEAHKIRKVIVKRKGTTIVNRQVKKSIKEYARKRFGKAAYWPYLALYTEIRGEFIKGWLPYDYYHLVLLPKINPQNYCHLSEQKTFDHTLFGEFAVRPLLVFISGRFYNSGFEFVEKSQVKNFLSDYNEMIVVKEEYGVGGKQVSIVHSSEFIPENLKKNINYTIQPYVKQYKVLHDLYPESVNTFRVNTFLKTDGSVTVKFVFLRSGLDGLKVDNTSSGGQYLFFDTSGNQSNLAYDDFGFNIGDRHKNTGYLFSDIKIPMFPEILEKCKNAHKKYPYVRFIAWDVCIDSSGEPKLLEWNTINPGFWPQEAKFGPFWTDDNEI
jgi:hypothetical protein